MQPWKRLTVPAFTVFGSVALATGAEQPFRGTAKSVVPPTACHGALPRPAKTVSGYVYSPLLQLPSLLELRACWIGRLRGQSFSLIGYTDSDNDSAVLVRYGRHQALLPISNGTPTVTGFTGNVVCFIPNLAKGVAYPVDIVHQRLLPGPDVLCRPVWAARATNVSGLSKAYRIGADGSSPVSGRSGR